MNNIYITACGKKDGLGSQISSKILAILFCKKNNYTYVHTPLQILDYVHKGDIQDYNGFNAYQNGKGFEWVNTWENMLNISNKLVNKNDYDKIIDITDVLKSGQITMKDNYLWHDFNPKKIIEKHNLKPYTKVLFLIKEFPKIDHYHESFCEPILKQLKANYNLTSKPKLHFDNKKFNIVFHKRHTGPYTLKRDTNLNAKNNRVTLNIYYIDIIKTLYKKYKEKDIQFWIFSDGDMRYFPEYELVGKNQAIIKNNQEPIKINMMLKTDSQEAFHHFVNADILVTDKSSFGYTAGFYNENIVIYNPYWDKKYSKWILKEDI